MQQAHQFRGSAVAGVARSPAVPVRQWKQVRCHGRELERAFALVDDFAMCWADDLFESGARPPQ